MVINRDIYLNRLIASKHNGLIKIITGLRRCGKSYLLFKLFKEHLRNVGVDDNHIIQVDLEDRRNKNLRNPDVLLAHIDSKMKDNDMYYILLDEVQCVKDFEDVLNSYLKIENADIYETGSNSKFLSTDIITEFRGRGTQICVHPLSFAEIMSVDQRHPIDVWNDYYTYGGLPLVLSLSTDEAKESYLKDLYAKVYKGSLLNTMRFRTARTFANHSVHDRFSNKSFKIGTFKSVKNVTLSSKTINTYLSYLEDAFLIEKSIRYDIKGKKYINTLAKHYFTDMGIRNAILGFRKWKKTILWKM